MPVFMYYGNETMIWKEKKKSRIRAVQMDNLRGLLGVRRMVKDLKSQIKELCRVMKVFSSGSAMWREWRMTGLLRRLCSGVCR